MCDEEGIIRGFNPEAERQHGIDRKPVPPAEWATAYGLRDLRGQALPLTETPLYRALKGERVEDARWAVRRPDGSLCILTGTALPLHHADGSPAGAVVTTRDETERLRLEEDLRRESAHHPAALRGGAGAAPGQGRVPGHRVPRAAHAVAGHPGLGAPPAGDGRGPGPSPRTAWTTIERNAKVQAQLVDDILDASRLVSGTMQLEWKRGGLRRRRARGGGGTPGAGGGQEGRAARCACPPRPWWSVATPPACSRSCGTWCPTRSSSRPRAGASTWRSAWRTARPSSVSRTPGSGSRRSSFPTCSIGSARRTARRRAPTAAWAWGWPWSATSSRCTVGTWRRTARAAARARVFTVRLPAGGRSERRHRRPLRRASRARPRPPGRPARARRGGRRGHARAARPPRWGTPGPRSIPPPRRARPWPP